MENTTILTQNIRSVRKQLSNIFQISQLEKLRNWYQAKIVEKVDERREHLLKEEEAEWDADKSGDVMRLSCGIARLIPFILWCELAGWDEVDAIRVMVTKV